MDLRHFRLSQLRWDSKHTRHRGFTLVEVLVAVSLLSVIMVALGSAMRTMAQTESRVDQRLQRMDELRVARGLLQQLLGRVSVRQWPALSTQGDVHVAFRATAQRIEWVGIMPARHGLGGRHFFCLQTEGDSHESNLVLRFVPWDVKASAFPDWAEAEARVLLSDVTEFEVLAEGSPSNSQPLGTHRHSLWTIGWPDKDYLPQRVRLRWSKATGELPDLVIPVRGLSQGAGAAGGFVIGGTR